jgi:hypothetical protein
MGFSESGSVEQMEYSFHDVLLRLSPLSFGKVAFERCLRVFTFVRSKKSSSWKIYTEFSLNVKACFPWLSGSEAVCNAVLVKAQSRGYDCSVYPGDNLARDDNSDYLFVS